MKRRINPVSTRQSKRLAEYRKAKQLWKGTLIVLGVWFCRRCGGKPEDSPHHFRGRAGRLLTYFQLFVPVCGKCHQWIHDNPQKAREANLLCTKGEWGKQP